MTKTRINKVYAEIPEEERTRLTLLAKLGMNLQKPTETALKRVVVEYYLMSKLAGETHVSEK